MMSKIRKSHSSEFKYRVALAALKGEETMAALSQRFGVHVSQIQKWKAYLEEQGPKLFADGRHKEAEEKKATISQLHEKIGQLTVERDFLARVLGR